LKNFVLGAVVTAALAFGVGGCASIVEGTTQDIAVSTDPAGAACTFMRDGQQIGIISSTPGTLKVQKSKYDISIICEKEGYEKYTYFNESGLSPVSGASIVADSFLTFGVSSIVDSAMGADNHYQEEVFLALFQVETETVEEVETTVDSETEPVVVVPSASEPAAAKGTMKPIGSGE